MKANLHRLPVLKIDNVKVEKLFGLEFTTTIMPEGLSGVLGMDILSSRCLHHKSWWNILKGVVNRQLN